MTGEASLYCAVSTKARAMYGRRLRPPDYALMINMTSVAQIAAFLKQHPSFMDVLSGINENNIRRNYLESLIKSSFFIDYQKLRHFLSPEDMLFYRYYIMSLEMEYVLTFVQHLNSANTGEYRQHFTREVDMKLPLKIELLTYASTYREMLAAAEDCEFYPVLLRFEPPPGESVNFTALECALDGWRFNKLIKNAEKVYKGRVLSQITSSLGTQIDIINISRVLRLRNFYSEHPEAIFQFLIPVYHRLGTGFYRQLFRQPSDEEAMEFIRSSPLGRHFMGKGLYVELYYEKYLYAHYGGLINSAGTSILVPISYLALRQIEIRNLTHIIESVRYGIPPQRIYSYLSVIREPGASDDENTKRRGERGS